jgi:phosphohistidine phosphatase
MRQLILVRHAKSDQGHDELPDIDRPLNARGYRDAPRMAWALHARGVKPDMIVSSPAVRAISTALIFARELGFPAHQVVLDERLYEASPSTMTQVIAGHSAETLMLFGHNPTITELATDLSGVAFENVPTSGIVYLRFTAGSWAQAVTEGGELELFDYPKNHN